ncbi:AmmeMemoRadiSam system protein A [Omnitrophica bacterium]|nr:AmmeMemoRadiSam system protein A [Candidatus Omnitrophota bacterium]
MPAFTSNNSGRLLELARKAIEYHLDTSSLLPVGKVPDELLVPLGCFVTLKKRGQLRGCIGTFSTTEPLAENVIRMAVAAAFKDPRFPKVQHKELPDIKIDLSVLGPMEKVESLDEIEIGKHGIHVRLGYKSGTFLPEVAVEQKWSVPEFVTYCAREKAGLDPKQIAQAEISRYTVDKISE